MGKYLARVRAVNAAGAISQPTLSLLTTVAGKTTPPPALTALTALTRQSIVFGIQIAWAFPPGATGTQRTELWYGAGPNRDSAIKQRDFAYPQARHQIDGLAAGERFFLWGRLVDRSGNIGSWYPAGAGVMGEASTDRVSPTGIFPARFPRARWGRTC